LAVDRPHDVLANPQFLEAAVLDLNRLEQEHTLAEPSQRGDRVEHAVDDQRPGHAGPDLKVGRGVSVRMVPEQSGGMSPRNPDLIVRHLARGDVSEDVIRGPARRHGEAVGMQIRDAAEAIDQSQADDIARAHAERRRDIAPIVRGHVYRLPGDVDR
jgi:hypothetical protein